jgi:hypothetical protein
MSIADTRLSLDGYRIHVFEKLRACRDPDQVRDLLTEVDLMLNACGLSYSAQRAFWEGLHTDLDVSEESNRLLTQETAATLAAVIAAAQAEIGRYLILVSSNA